MNYKETQAKVAALFNKYCSIKDEDINAIAEVYPLTVQAIYDVKKAAPEARFKVIAVTIPKDVLATDNVNAAFVAVRNEVSKRFNNELANLMFGQREFGTVAQANRIVSMTNRAFSTLVTTLQDSAVSGVIRSELTCELNESTVDGVTIAHPEICVAAIIKEVDDPEVHSWYAKNYDLATANKLYHALHTMTHYDYRLAKRNSDNEAIHDFLKTGQLIARRDEIPQGLFDNPKVTMKNLLKWTNGMKLHFNEVVLADSLGFDLYHFVDKVDKQQVDGDYAELGDECGPDINTMLINNFPALVVRYDICNCDSVMDGNKVALVLNCDHPDVTAYMEKLAGIEERAKEAAIAEYKKRHGKDPKFMILREQEVWAFFGNEHDCCDNACALDMELIDEYVAFLVKVMVTEAENYDKDGSPYRAWYESDYNEDEDEEDGD